MAFSEGYLIDANSSYYINQETWEDAPGAGDTIFISSERVLPLKFQFITGEQNNPVVVINYGGQVNIDGRPNTWGALTFENCRYIKVTGEGDEGYKYGFILAAQSCGLAFAELSSDCEAAFVKISHDGFFGIMAKKNYDGNPPSPIPVFSNLVIHDCFVENVTEGMYLGETKSPGMEFKNVRIYNNIVRNTGRESMQIANMVEDVEIYNNTLLNAGLDEENYQNNLLQIGDNSVAKVYNNIMMEAPGCGIISFGMGDNIYTNNYISTCKGIFLDERKFTNEEAPIEITANYFTNNVDMGWVIRNMNQYNSLLIADNLYDYDSIFYKNDSGNNGNYTLENNTNTDIDSLLFTNVEENDYSLAMGNPAAYMDLGAPGGPEYGDTSSSTQPVSKQIILNADMIVDEVEGGSLWTAAYLVDEQDIDIETEHATSQSWKPYWNMDKAPYHIYFDLGSEYELALIALHDMNDTKNMEVSIGKPGNWESLFIEPCDKYKTWKQHDVNVITRYVRFSMTESVFAAVNEVQLYGYQVEEPDAPQIQLSADMIVDEVEGGSLWTAAYLVDEQDIDIETEHATSQSWKPYWNMDKAPYHIYFDLGTEHELTLIALHDMNNTKNMEVSIGKPGNWESLFIEPCDKYKTWKQHDVNVTTRYVRFSMTESVFAAVNEVQLYGYQVEEPDAPQIQLSADMIVDEVEGGSLWTAAYLVDEQDIDIETEHATSQSWKPYWNMNHAPYHIYFDLGAEYELTLIALHDMNNISNMEVSIGEPGNWESLFIEPCDKYKTWKQHDVNVSTRYVRFSMTESVFASVNEVQFYGYSNENRAIQEKSAMVETTADAQTIKMDNLTEDLFLCQNPVKNTLILKIPDELNHNFKIEVYNLNGMQLFSKEYVENPSSKLMIDISEKHINNGINIVRYSNQKGICKSLTFLKTNY